MLGQAMTIGGAILFAFLTAWVFGREFADRTVRNLLANPTPRGTIVVAKSIVIGIWALGISAWVLALGLGIGALIGLPGWSSADAIRAVASIAVAATLTIGLQTWAAFFAGLGRGFIAPLAWTVGAIVAAQVLAVLGWGRGSRGRCRPSWPAPAASRSNRSRRPRSWSCCSWSSAGWLQQSPGGTAPTRLADGPDRTSGQRHGQAGCRDVDAAIERAAGRDD